MRRRRRAVSEIIGTILILSLTVVLFAAIFYFVSTLPPPASQSNSQFTAQLGLSAGNTEAFLNITYQAGPALTPGNTAIYLASSLHSSDYTCARGAQYGNPYSTTQGLSGASSSAAWTAGETWQLHLVVGTTVCPGGNLGASGDNITISIVGLSNNVLLFHVTLPGSSPNLPPQFYNYGVVQSTGTGTTQPFTIYTYVQGALQYEGTPAQAQVWATYTSVGGTKPALMTYNPANGEFAVTICGSTVVGTCVQPTTSPSANTPYSFIINATGNGTGGIPTHNNIIFYFTFPAQAASAALIVSLTTSVGNPVVHQTVELTAKVTGAGGTATPGVCVNFTWASSAGPTGNIPLPGGLSTGCNYIAANGLETVSVSDPWTAGPSGDGDYSLTATASDSLTSSSNTVSLTVFPRTLLIDETGVSPGSNSSTDTFTYLETDLNSADVPYNTTIVPPGASAIGWDCAAPSCLNNYDVVIWLLSNTGSLQAGDMINLEKATSGNACSPACPGDRSIWLVGANALTGASSNLQSSLGLNTITPQTLGSSASPSYPAITATAAPAAIPTAGIIPGDAYLDGFLGGLWSQPNYDTINPNAAQASSFLTISSGANSGKSVAIAYNGTWKALSMPFELSALAETNPYCVPGTCTYQTSLGQQSSIVYDAYNWLANLTMPGLPLHRSGSDWAVSEVNVEPTTLAFNTPAWVNVTVRNNGPVNATFTAELLVDNVPVYVGGSPVIISVDPSPMGGVQHFTFDWTPSYIGFLSIGACIIPPTSDLSATNNCLGNSLFASQLYVNYNVLLVDSTLHSSVPSLSDSTPYVYQALLADGFPTTTITNASVAAGCGSLPSGIMADLSASPPHFNMVVWNLGDVTNTSGTSCPLGIADATALESFLSNGGASSSLLMLGNGLLTDSLAAGHATGAITNFMGSFLGLQQSSIVSVPASANDIVYGAVNSPLADGLSLTYGPSGATQNLSSQYGFSSLNYTTNEYKQFGLYFDQPDYWTPGSTLYGAGVTDYSTSADWHSGYLALNPDRLGEYQMTGELENAMLRFSTFAGRLLPKSEATASTTGITFATATQPWSNFDQVEPQLNQQYLVNANITNLGGAAAYSVGVEVFDGHHILGSTSQTVGPSVASAQGNTTFTVSTISISWTPLFGATNAISVEITTSPLTAAIANIGQFGEWNLTVYYFYDNGGAGENVWTHNQVNLWQGPQDPSCLSPSSGQGIYFYAGHSNIPQEWPAADGSETTTVPAGNDFGTSYGYTGGGCETEWDDSGTDIYNDGYTQTYPYSTSRSVGCNSHGTCYTGYACTIGTDTYDLADGLKDMYGNINTYCEGVWGVDNMGAGDTGDSGDACYQVVASYNCASLGILDSNYISYDCAADSSGCGSVDENPDTAGYAGSWAYSSPIYIPADIGSASASWFQRYDLAFQFSGVTTCVLYVAGTQGTIPTQTSFAGASNGNPVCGAGPKGTVPTPAPSYSGTTSWISGGACTTLSTFTGSSGGGTEQWQYENMSLSQYAGDWVEVGFDWMTSSLATPCSGSAPSFSGIGFYVNSLEITTTGPTSPSSSDQPNGGNEPSGDCEKVTGSSPTSATSYYPQYIPEDLWHETSASTQLTATGITGTSGSSLPSGALGAWVDGAPSGSGGALQLAPNMWDTLLTRSVSLTSASQATLSFNYVMDRVTAAGSPPQGLEVQVAPVTSNGEFVWTTVWNGGTTGTSGTTWQSSGSISLNNYIGQVVEVAFVAGTNCNDGGSYPATGVFGITNVAISGPTIVSAVTTGPQLSVYRAAATMPVLPPLQQPTPVNLAVQSPLTPIPSAAPSGELATRGEAIAAATPMAATAPRAAEARSAPNARAALDA